MKAVQITTSRKIKVENVRAKLQSLRNLTKGEEDSLVTIQKCLQKHNTMQDPETTQQFDQKDDDDEVVIDERLWHYFQKKSKQYEHKLEKEKVNGWQQIMKTILVETEKKIKVNQGHVDQMESIITNKYKQTHSLFRQIEAIKLEKSLEKGSRRKRSNVETSRGQKIVILQQNIAGLKQEIQSRTQENQKIKIELRRLHQQRLSLLLNIVKAGYYLTDGIKFFLQKMVEIGYVPSMRNFPDFLDARSKEFLMKEYEQLSKKYDQEKQNSYRGESSRIRAKSHIELGQLAKHEHFKQIYSGTKDYLLKLLLKEDWRKEQIKLPKIGQKNDEDLVQKEREAEKKRIKIAYPEELRQLVKKIEFGVKLDTILS